MPAFNQIPAGLLVPFMAIEFDSSAANQGAPTLPYRALIIGQKLAGGSAAADSFVKITRADDAIALTGRGSMLHRQAIKWFKQNEFTELWLGVLADNGAGVAATGTLTFTGPATAAGTLSLWLGGNLIQVAVASGDTATTIATNVAAAITAAADLPVTAAPALGVVTLTYRHKGTVGNDFDMRANYQDGQKLPAGVTLAVVPMSAGATNPVLTALIAAMGDTWYNIIAHPYTDATSLTALENDLARRDGPMVQADGMAFTSALGTVSVIGTLGGTRNSQFNSIHAQPGKNPLTPPVEFAAALAAAVALYGNIDPARPLQTLPLIDVLPPAEADLFTLTERNLLLGEGIGTTKVGPGGVVQIERPVTTYQKNAAGAADTAYRDVTTRLTLMYARYAFRTQILTKYPRHKVANDGTRFGPGQLVITPKIGKAEALHWFELLEEQGLFENFEDFKANVVCARSLTDPSRLEWLLPPNLINGFIVGASQIQFRL